MIFRRYGSSYQSVDVDFDAMAFNDIGFRRNRQEKIPVAGFDDAYALMETVELPVEADGPVQTEPSNTAGPPPGQARRAV